MNNEINNKKYNSMDYQIAKNNTKYNSEGRAIIEKGDEWIEEEEWDFLFEQLRNNAL